LGYRPDEGQPVAEHQVMLMDVWKRLAEDAAPLPGDFFETAVLDGRRRIESEHIEAGPPDVARLENLVRYISTRAWTL